LAEAIAPSFSSLSATTVSPRPVRNDESLLVLERPAAVPAAEEIPSGDQYGQRDKRG
jgi:hypothetical protein